MERYTSDDCSVGAAAPASFRHWVQNEKGGGRGRAVSGSSGGDLSARARAGRRRSRRRRARRDARRRLARGPPLRCLEHPQSEGAPPPALASLAAHARARTSVRRGNPTPPRWHLRRHTPGCCSAAARSGPTHGRPALLCAHARSPPHLRAPWTPPTRPSPGGSAAGRCPGPAGALFCGWRPRPRRHTARRGAWRPRQGPAEAPSRGGEARHARSGCAAARARTTLAARRRSAGAARRLRAVASGAGRGTQGGGATRTRRLAARLRCAHTRCNCGVDAGWTAQALLTMHWPPAPALAARCSQRRLLP